ncbi:hypothetical protein GLYMA_09G087950v4 [Glycine max]|nr:hypothetical protein GLYMA_09G087950v4 [Glycine max]
MWRQTIFFFFFLMLVASTLNSPCCISINSMLVS